MTTTITPFLMFEGKAELAMTFYVALFPDSQILELRHYGPSGPGVEGSVSMARFRVGGLEVMCNDSTVKHAFTFTPSTSLFVNCADEAEIDRIFTALTIGGEVLMALSNYGFSRKFGWVNDRYGVSWQINLP